MNPTDSGDRVAVLIDGENVSFTIMAGLVAEVAKYGTASVRRIYGDWTSPFMKGWSKCLLDHSLIPIQQFAYTTGKNATDGAMIIDAMDLLYTDRFSSFCLVSSDSDFTRLAARIREQGIPVYGFGNRHNTHRAFVAACNEFVYFDALPTQAEAPIDPTESNDSNESREPYEAPTSIKPSPVMKPPSLNTASHPPTAFRQPPPTGPRSMTAARPAGIEPPARPLDQPIPDALRKAISSSNVYDEENFVNLAEVGDILVKIAPDMNARNYGFPRLRNLVQASGIVDVKMEIHRSWTAYRLGTSEKVKEDTDLFEIIDVESLVSRMFHLMIPTQARLVILYPRYCTGPRIGRLADWHIKAIVAGIPVRVSSHMPGNLRARVVHSSRRQYQHEIQDMSVMLVGLVNGLLMGMTGGRQETLHYACGAHSVRGHNIMMFSLPRFEDLIAVEQAGDDKFVSKVPPTATGKDIPIAYGGCTIAIATRAACETVDPKFHLFSVLGSFLGPSRPDQRVYCRVSRSRDTRTFATRHVVAFQYQKDGSERVTSQMFIDFHVKEPALVTYCPPLRKDWGDPADGKSALPAETILQRAIAAGKVTPAGAEGYLSRLAMMYKYADLLHCIEGVGAQNVFGLDQATVTNQDHLPIHERVTAEWTRLKTPLKTYAENVSALGFLADAGLSAVAIQHSRLTHADISSASTLDFALRIMTDEVDVNDWIMRDRRAVAAGHARTYSEMNLYKRDGTLIAIMSQTCIARPAQPKKTGGGEGGKVKL